MAVGLRIRHPTNNSILVDVSDSLTRIGGTFNTGTSNGSFTIPPDLVGRPFFQVLASADVAISTGNPTPAFTISGRTITWSFYDTNRVAARVRYGVY